VIAEAAGRVLIRQRNVCGIREVKIALTNCYFLWFFFFLHCFWCDGKIAVSKWDIVMAAGRCCDGGGGTWFRARRLPPSLTGEGYWWWESRWMWAAHSMPLLLLYVVSRVR